MNARADVIRTERSMTRDAEQSILARHPRSLSDLSLSRNYLKGIPI